MALILTIVGTTVRISEGRDVFDVEVFSRTRRKDRAMGSYG